MISFDEVTKCSYCPEINGLYVTLGTELTWMQKDNEGKSVCFYVLTGVHLVGGHLAD